MTWLRLQNAGEAPSGAGVHMAALAYVVRYDDAPGRLIGEPPEYLPVAFRHGD